MAVSQTNRIRWRAVQLARTAKELFARAFIPRRWFYRWLFRGENGDLRQVGEYVLADLRQFCGADKLEIFHTDPQVQAYRLGKQAVFRRIVYFLNLDEAAVQKLMELDDGL